MCRLEFWVCLYTNSRESWFICWGQKQCTTGLLSWVWWTCLVAFKWSRYIIFSKPRWSRRISSDQLHRFSVIDNIQSVVVQFRQCWLWIRLFRYYLWFFMVFSWYGVVLWLSTWVCRPFCRVWLSSSCYDCRESHCVTIWCKKLFSKN